MNVFALLGTLEGDSPLDVLIDGNGMLDQLEITCTGRPINPLCPILEDQIFLMPIDVDFEGNTYGVGTVLAGGWNNWFVTVPITFVYADIKGKDTDGYSTTVTPRFGRVFNMGRGGNLALFAGANYLDTELTIAGTEVTPDGLLTIDYTIEQKNKDKWNLLLGGNWNITKRWSWSLEYDGFIGSREAIITSLTWRY